MEMTGRTLGNYDILKEIGRGGMAVVYRAYQRSLNRHVAVKVLPPYMSHDREFVERFQREARASAQLRHPNIVVIHDVAHESVGPDQDMHYIVMELLEGRTLKQVVEQEGALPVERAARIVEQVASALDYAHQRGLVHRDVKPANIFVGKDDHVTLADFGIAKAASEAQQLTRTGMLMGTPEYMSPEQAEGREVDYRTDLYALGVVAYQMLCGRVPFRGTTPHAVLHNVIYEPPPPLRQLRPELSPAVEAAVMKAIDKQPQRRYQSGAELAAALRKPPLHGERLVVPAGPGAPRPGAVSAPPAASQPKESAARKPLVWILGAIALILCVLGAVLAILILGGSDSGEATLPPATAVTLASHTATLEPGPPASATEAPAVATEPPAGTAEPTAGATEPPTNTPEPPTATWTPTPSRTPTATPTPCAFAPTGLFATLWQSYREELGCPLYQAPKAIQDAEQVFDNGHMFWRQDNDYAYVVYEQGPSTGKYQAFSDLWTEGDPEYSCAASPPPGKVQPKRGFGAVWCNLGAASAPIGWGLQEEAGFGPGYGDPLVQQFQRGFIFRDSDGKTTGRAYVFMRDTMTFVRALY